MATSRSQGQLAGVLVVVAVIIALVFRKKASKDSGRSLPNTAAVSDAARHARSSTSSTISKATGAAHGLITEASDFLSSTDIDLSLDRLTQALEDVRSALGKAVSRSGS
jgi:hypothetical protein